MKKIILPFLLAVGWPYRAYPQESTLDERINDAISPITSSIFNFVMTPIEFSEQISLPIVLIVLLCGAAYFTVYFGFPNFTRVGLAINVVRGKYQATKTESRSPNIINGDDPDTIRKENVEGEVSPFQALTAALSATVGLGNIGMVAVAIVAGGPGATFWMIIAGMLGMASKFTECTLGVKYREVMPDGTVHGGPMYYLSKGLKERGWATLGKIFGVFYAIMLVGGSFGGGNMFQSNQAAAQFTNVLNSDSGYSGFAFGCMMALSIAVVIIGGIKRIGKVTERIVPLMVGIYLFAALIILAKNIAHIPAAIQAIIQGAFAPEAAMGGFFVVLVIGFQRAAFSNEAGVGSASVAHSAVKTQYAASEGVVALLEPFIDTVIVCTITALVIIVTNIDGQLVEYGNASGLNGVTLTSAAFDSVIPGFSYVLTIAVILFAFSTMLSWSYYGLQAWKYLFGKGRLADYLYKILFCSFVILGAASSLGAVVQFSDAMIFAMIFPNMIGLLFLAPVVKEEYHKYLQFIENHHQN
ncbi:MAG: alanine/glycine:cation symporter family protein [Bacteroidota bacterium]